MKRMFSMLATSASALGLSLVLVLPAPAQQALDKYQEFLANNPPLAQQKINELVAMLDFLRQNGVPFYKWECRPMLFDVSGPFLNSPSCRGTSSGPGPVVRLSPGADFPQGTDVFIFGVLDGRIAFVGAYDGGSVNQTPDATGNVFAARLRSGESSCYANTTLGLWSHETRKEYLIPGPQGPFIPCGNVFFVLADDFGTAPQGSLNQFQRMFANLTML